MTELDDTTLIQQFKRGDTAAFNELVNRWQGKIHRFAYGFFADSDEASDITQKTFIKAYQKMDMLDDPGNFSPWIYRVANNLCLDELKRAGRRKSSPLEAWVEQSIEGEQLSPVDELEASELGKIIQKALLTLPDEQRVVVILKEYEGLKFREIAEILEEPENTVKSRLYYGLKALRRVLTKWNIPKHYLNYD
ncbi:MAG: RNA polymerase sigma factor [Balneolaceae bacterium]